MLAESRGVPIGLDKPILFRQHLGIATAKEAVLGRALFKVLVIHAH